MSLREELARRRAAEPPVIHCAFVKSEFSASRQPSGPTIKICQWQAGSWVLPWSRLDDAYVSGTSDHEELVLSFSTYQVKATGTNLSGLLDLVGRFHVDCLRNLPPEYRAKVQPGAPFIERLEVRPTNAVLSGRPGGEPPGNHTGSSLNPAGKPMDEGGRANVTGLRL